MLNGAQRYIVRRGGAFPSDRVVRFHLLILGMAVHLLLPQPSMLQHMGQLIGGMALWAVGLAARALRFEPEFLSHHD